MKILIRNNILKKKFKVVWNCKHFNLEKFNTK